MRHNPTTIEYITQRIETELPEQIERAAQILTKMTLEYHGQLSFDLNEAQQVNE